MNSNHKISQQEERKAKSRFDMTELRADPLFEKAL